MTFRALLVAGLLGPASGNISFVQIYSGNTVGYVDLELPAGLCLIANPFNHADNSLDTVFPNVEEGTTIYKFNPASQAYHNPCSYVDDYGWYPTNTLAPNEGAFIELAHAAKISLVGDVPPFPLFPCRLIPSGFSIQSLLHTEDVAFLLPRDGDTIYQFDRAAQSYKDPYSYIGGFGWFSANLDDPGPNGPRIPAGTAFWLSGWPGCRCPCCIEFPVCGPAVIPSPTGLWLLNPSRTNTVFRFEFASELATRYEVQRTDSLSGPWTTVQIVTGDGTTVQIEDRNAAAGKSYYRLVKLP